MTTPPAGFDMTTAMLTLVVALGCGLLIGVERERRKGSGPGRAMGGLRTFTLSCVSGAATALTGMVGLVIVGAATVAALVAVAYWRDRSDDPGVTTEVALLLTYVIGVLCTVSWPLAAGMAVGLTAILAGRERMHRFASQWLTPAELRDGILLAALVLLALPLTPDRPLWGSVLNPHATVRLLALLLAVQALAHLARRLLAARHAVALSSLAAGFVSSTVTIASQGVAVREGRGTPRLMAGGGLLSCVPTQVQMLMVALAMQPAWWSHLWPSALLASVAAGLWAMWMLRGVATADPLEPATPRPDQPMFSLRSALLIVALLVGVQALVHGLSLWWGETGLLAGALLGALVDLHAALAAVFASGPPAAVGHGAVALALLVHAASKTVTAAVAGGRSYVLWLAPGLWAHTVLGVLVLGW